MGRAALLEERISPFYLVGKKEMSIIDNDIKKIRLKAKSSEYRLTELEGIRMQACSDESKIKDYLYFIAEELILLNYERRK